MSSEIAIKVKNLSKCYQIYDKPHDRLKQSIYPRLQRLVGKQPRQYFREFWALQDVSFEIKRGETVGIIGRNGSGKSTLLQMICGTLNPTGGCIETHGRIAALLELGSGFNPEFTGRENVYLNAAVLGLSNEEIEERFDDIVAFADIDDFIDQPVKTYSSGMYVRLAFSVATNVSPSILVVDEALAVGDVAFQAKCMKRFEDFRQNGTTILLATHDLGSVLQFSSRCILLDAGMKSDIEQPKLAVDTFKRLLLGKDKSPSRSKTIVNARVSELQAGNWARNHEINTAGCEIYGNKKAQISDFGIFDGLGNIAGQRLFFGERYVFKMKVAFQEVVENPIFTITFRDLTGREIAGTNTLNKRMFTGNFSSGDIAEVSFNIETRLAPGRYLLTFACSGFERDEFLVYERLYHILILEVYGTEQIVGYFDLQAGINLQKERG
jgi:ABC-type polysaccharide/polyol phosphate transport system ATPase subunit